MAWIEALAKRTAKAKVYLDDVSGKLRLVTSIHDQHYHDGAAWQDADENLENDTLSGYAHKADKLRHAIHVGSTGTRRWYPRRNAATEYVEFGRLQTWTGTAWQNLNLGTPTRAGQRLSWSTTNFDLTLGVTWKHVKIAVTLKTATAKRRIRWAVALVGLTYQDGALISQADGATVGYVEKPIAWDANGSIENQNVAITSTYAGGYIEFGGDLTAAVLPITIDPTLTDGYGGDVTTAKDTYLKSSTATTNYGTDTRLRLYLNTHNGLIDFDLSGIAADATCDSAVLTTFLSNGGGTAYTLAFAELLGNNRNWTEAGATWNTYDGTNNWIGSAGCQTSGTDYDATPLGTVSIPAGTTLGEQLDATLTAASVEAKFAGTLALRFCHSGGADRYLCSSDHATTGYRPYLVVTYTAAGGTAYDGSLTLARTAALTGGGVAGVLGTETLARTATVAATGQGAGANTVALARVAAVTETALAGTAGSTTLARTAAIGESAAAAAFASASLARTAAMTEAAQAGAAPSVALAREAALSVASIAGVTPEITLAVNRALSAGALASTSPALTLATTRTLSSGGSAAALGNVSLAQVLALLASGAVGAEANIILAQTLAIEVSTAASMHYDMSVSLGRVAGIASSGAAAASDVITLAATLVQSETAAASATAALELAKRQVINALAQAVVNAGLPLSSIRTITASGGQITLTLAARTYAIAADDRVYSVAAESRVTAIAAESRVIVIS